MIDIHDTHQIDELFRTHRADPQHLRRLRIALYKHYHGPTAALATLPDNLRSDLENKISLCSLELQSHHDSELDGATRLVFRTHASLAIETVILRVRSGRTALCVSCQAGCAAHCRFCATGQMGTAHSLSSSEILDQVLQAGELLRSEGRRIRNVVFMGMGEPLHNEPALDQSLEVLMDSRCCEFAPRRILVSTVGIPDGMLRLARRHPGVRMALSLHSARQDVREQIIPLARRHSLAELRGALVEVIAIQRQPVMIEYLLLDTVNDSPADAAALADYLRGLDVHVNLIPYNPIDEAPQLRGTPAAGRAAFQALLQGAGYRVTMRHSLGGDIAAACGQLVRRENRAALRMAQSATAGQGAGGM